MNAIAISIFIAYIIAVIFVGYIGLRRSKKSSEDFFVAGRSVGPLLLFFSLAATNFSAFFFFGFAGAAYKYGFGYYGIMAIGTSLMAITFFLLGRRIWRIGKGYSLITPPELFGVRYRDKPLRFSILVVFVLFTLPYIATQAIGGGIAIQTLTEGAVSFEMGAVIVTAVIASYLMLGGMRSDVLTDLLQGVMMVVVALAAIGFVSYGFGGFNEANAAALEAAPALFSLPGGAEFFTIQIWISYLLLWTFCDPLFPQLFQRFYAARDERAIRTSMLAYPVVTAALFIAPVLIGVWGNVDFTLTGSEVDNIMPLMLSEHAPGWAFGLVMAAGFAALMSTADSQLLVLSSMLTRDVCSFFRKGKVTSAMEIKTGRAIILVLALASLGIALSSIESIFSMLTKTTFTGLAILFPATVATLYWKKASATGCISSILIGEGLYALIYFEILPSGWMMGFIPAIPLVLISTAVLIVVSMFTKKPDESLVSEFFGHLEKKRKTDVEATSGTDKPLS